MKADINYDDSLYSFYSHVMFAVCGRFKCWPHEVLNRRRTEPVSRARHVIAYVLRRHVSRKPGTNEWVIDETIPVGNRPLSTTKLASLLRIDHSAVLYSSKLVTDDVADWIDDAVWQSWLRKPNWANLL